MHNLLKIQHIAFADDDSDDHELFSAAITEIAPAVLVSEFYRCDTLIDFLNDESGKLPDLIFMDYNMAGNIHNECLITLKKTARTLHIPVIIYSTSDYSKFVEAAYGSGAYKFVRKPSDFREIKAMLKEIITEIEEGGQMSDSLIA